LDYPHLVGVELKSVRGVAHDRTNRPLGHTGHLGDAVSVSQHDLHGRGFLPTMNGSQAGFSAVPQPIHRRASSVVTVWALD